MSECLAALTLWNSVTLPKVMRKHRLRHLLKQMHESTYEDTIAKCKEFTNKKIIYKPVDAFVDLPPCTATADSPASVQTPHTRHAEKSMSPLSLHRFANSWNRAYSNEILNFKWNSQVNSKQSICCVPIEQGVSLHLIPYYWCENLPILQSSKSHFYGFF